MSTPKNNKQAKLTLLALVLSAAMALQACSEKGDTSSQVAAPPPTVATSAASQAEPAAPAGPVTNLRISGYGPNPIKAGEPFNVQPNQQAALWLRVDQSLDGTDAAVYLGSVRLQSYISGKLITASVPANLYAKPGHYILRIAGTKGNQHYQSNAVQFVVQ
jgi:hypothetical protein